MDPEATLEQLIEALEELHADPSAEDARKAAIDHLENLLVWIKGGGFSPSPFDVVEAMR